MNENEHTTYWNVQNSVKAVLEGKRIPVNAYVKKGEKSQLNNLNFHRKTLEKEEQTKPSKQKGGNNKK